MAVIDATLNFINKSVTLAELKDIIITGRRNGSIAIAIDGNATGLWYWNATSTATADDIVIVQSNLTSTGRWIRLTFTQANIFEDITTTLKGYTLMEKDATVGEDIGAGGSGKNGNIRVRKSDNSYAVKLLSTAKSEFSEGITDLPDGVDPTDAATVNQLDTHVHEDTKVQLITISAYDEYEFTLDYTPDLTAAFQLTRNGNNTYIYGRGDFTVSGTTLTWQHNATHGGDGTIPLMPDDTLDLIYNQQNGTSGTIANITEKGFGINVKHIGENTWYSSENNTINVLHQADNDQKVVYIRVAKNLPVNTEITDENSNISHAILENGQLVPHAGILKRPMDMALVSNVSIVRDGSTITVENPSAQYINVGCEVFIQGVTPGDYNGTWIVTSVDAENDLYTYDIGSATPGAVTVLGTTTFHYDPNPYFNNCTVIYGGTGKIILKDNILIDPGYNFDVIKQHPAGNDVSIWVMGSVRIKAMFETISNEKEWTSSSGYVPFLPSYGTLRLYYSGLDRTSGDPTWYIQYCPVKEQVRT